MPTSPDVRLAAKKLELNYASKATVNQNPEETERKQILAHQKRLVEIFSICNKNANENSNQGESVFERDRCR